MFGETLYFLHISDLHFANHLASENQDNFFKESIKNRGIICQTADSNVYSILKETLDHYLTSISRSGFDGIFLTGDICTDPTNSRSFDHPAQFLFNELYDNRDIGLNLDPNITFCVPGNHDKMMEKSMDKYMESIFAPQKQLNSYGDYLCSLKLGWGKNILIYGLNSNRLDIRIPAMGRINLSQVTTMRNTLSELSQATTVYWSDKGYTVEKKGNKNQIEKKYAKFDSVLDSTFKILLMHHHPTKAIYNELMWSKNNISDKFGIATRFMDMIYDQSYDEFITLLDEYPFDLIIHGHLHFPAIYNLKKCLVISGGSTCERTKEGEGQSFNIIKVRLWSQPEVEIITFVYQKSDIIRQFIPYGWAKKRRLSKFLKSRIELHDLKETEVFNTVSSSYYASAQLVNKIYGNK